MPLLPENNTGVGCSLVSPMINTHNEATRHWAPGAGGQISLLWLLPRIVSDRGGFRMRDRPVRSRGSEHPSRPLCSRHPDGQPTLPTHPQSCCLTATPTHPGGPYTYYIPFDLVAAPFPVYSKQQQPLGATLTPRGTAKWGGPHRISLSQAVGGWVGREGSYAKAHMASPQALTLRGHCLS